MDDWAYVWVDMDVDMSYNKYKRGKSAWKKRYWQYWKITKKQVPYVRQLRIFIFQLLPYEKCS